MYYVRIIDETGMFIRDDFVEELTDLTIETPCEGGFYKPKWDGEKWVEGLTTDEINAIKNVEQPKSESEIIQDLQRQLLATQMLLVESELN